MWDGCTPGAMVEVVFSVRAGPDVRPPIWLPVGRHVVGSGRTASLQLEDPFLEPHHVEIVVDAAGSWQIRELTGSITKISGSDDPPDAVSTTDQDEFFAGASRIVLARSQTIRWLSSRSLSEPRLDQADRRIAVVRPLRAIPADPASELAEVGEIRAERERFEPPSGAGAG